MRNQLFMDYLKRLLGFWVVGNWVVCFVKLRIGCYHMLLEGSIVVYMLKNGYLLTRRVGWWWKIV
ncbi:transmembrane protein, putative [Medicago truncatula]|uniref:Transmembrane protein, putative n=1 Tax=Medicago truncatula TaxID=3880 RepID=A0A072VME5_MEDTR|nr:transmembrane protein, putative [Medicago truncatula]